MVLDAVAKAEQVQMERKTAYMDAVPTFCTSSMPQRKNPIQVVSDIPLEELASQEGNTGPPALQQSIDSDSEDYDDKTDASNDDGWERFQSAGDPFDNHGPFNSVDEYSQVKAPIETWDPPEDKSSKVGYSGGRETGFYLQSDFHC